MLTDALMPDVDGFTLATEIARRRTARGDQSHPAHVGRTRRGPEGQAGAATFAATLTKPVKQSDLLDAIVTAFAVPTVPPPRRARGASGAPPGEESRGALTSRARGEDNVTNQKLVLALLKQRGHDVVVVGNGRQAVDTSAAQPFDVILMDVQMPEMGGLEATAAIRARERDSRRPHARSSR